MNVSDNRRIPVPEVSASPALYQVNKSDLSSGRRDGRSLQQSRGVYLQAGVVGEAKGSAYIEMGETKVICAVHGPRDFERRNDFQMKGLLKCEFKFAPFSCPTRRKHIPDSDEIELSQVLTQALESAVQLQTFPKSQVDVIVTVLDNDGACLSAAVIAAATALADAGIEMYDLVTAATVTVHNKELVHDPCLHEEYSANNFSGNIDLNHGNVTVAMLPMLDQVTAITSIGAMETDVLMTAVSSATECARKVYPLLQKAVLETVKT